MAHKLRSFDFTHTSTISPAEKINYPWDDWLDGDIWELTAGEDFQTHPLMMERIIRTRATSRGARVRMRHVPMNGDQWGQIVLQRHDVLGPSAQKKAAAAEKRAARKAEAERAAHATLAAAGIKPLRSKARKPVKQVAKRPARPAPVPA